MTEHAIRVNNLGKRYAIGHVPNRHPTVRDFTNRLLRTAWRWRGSSKAAKRELAPNTFWALRNVSFEIAKGSVVGVIGRNGSGKSTLLKILSRITDPTEGKAVLFGRVGSLLEVGTGFHPELTGRENVFLYGAMLGMRRREIRHRFDDIVSFSETDQFLDTPVKHYSSGMYTRLAFAVAAHLDPDILVVDEVLAVGDAAFQKKCLNKMEAVSRTGRTVMVVSHTMAIIQSKCQQCLWFDKGRLVNAGPVDKVLDGYIKEQAVIQSTPLVDRPDRQGNGLIRLERVAFLDSMGRESSSLITGGPGTIVVHFVNETGKRLDNVYFQFHIDDAAGYRVTSLMTRVLDGAPDVLAEGVRSVTFRIPRCPLAPGRFSYTLGCAVNGVVADSVTNAGTFHVEAGDFYGSGKPMPPGHGTFYMDYSFEVNDRPALREVA